METQLVLPEGFAEYAWEVEAKGVLMGASLSRGERLVGVTFYEPTRLAQDVEEDLNLDGLTTLTRVIVIKKVTLELIQQAVARLPTSFFD